MGEVGVIAAVGGIGAEIFDLEAFVVEVGDDFLFELITRVVAGDWDNF